MSLASRLRALAILLAAAGCRDAATAVPSTAHAPPAARLDASTNKTGVAPSYTVRILASKGSERIPRAQLLDIVHRLTDVAASEATINKRQVLAGHHQWRETQRDRTSGAVGEHRVTARGRDPYSTVQDVIDGTVVRETEFTWKHDDGVYRLDGYTMLVGPKGHELLRITAHFESPFGGGQMGRAVAPLVGDLKAAFSRRGIVPGGPSSLLDCDPTSDASCVDGCDPYVDDCSVSTDGYDASAYNEELNAVITDGESAANDGDIQVMDDQALADGSPDSCATQANNLRYATYATVVAIGALRQALYQANIPAILLALAAYGAAQGWQITQRNLLWECVAAWNKGHP